MKKPWAPHLAPMSRHASGTAEWFAENDERAQAAMREAGIQYPSLEIPTKMTLRRAG
jgi:general stress protein YciG